MAFDLAAVRARYADMVCREVGVASATIRRAFAAVARERFLGPPPWNLLAPKAQKLTRSADPEQVYANVLVELDSRQGINNGLPSLWAGTFSAAGIAVGESVLHVGTGAGYYTAIMAEIVGPTGSVLGVEIDPALAAKAKEALAPYPQIKVIAGNGLEVDTPQVDLIVASAGLSTIPATWLDRLTAKGRLVMPLTVVGDWPKPGGGTWHGGSGGMLVIRRVNADYSARFLCAVGFIPCVGADRSDHDGQLRQAFAGKTMKLVRSLHRHPTPPDQTCWLSTREKDR
jgi:protein-L-isoaspartate(D-aspartate) O-methyltransferase